jgi:hypothetical protein
MSQNKTKPTNKDVIAFLKSITPQQKQDDCYTLLSLMKEITDSDAVLWGDAIIGFGTYHYKYASGRESDWFLTGFSPRKNAISLYLYCDLDHKELSFENLEKHKRGKGCLYIKKLSDVDLNVLKTILQKAVALTASN